MGRFGDSTKITRYTPVKVKDASGVNPLENIIKIAAGDGFSLAVDSSGKVWAWGYNGYGQLGNNTTTQSNNPVQVKSDLKGVIDIAAGQYHSVALRVDGTVWTWGRNNSYQLGDNTNTTRVVPVQMLHSAGNPVTDGVQITALNATTMVLKDNGTVWGAGLNSSGQIGLNNLTTNITYATQTRDTAGTGYLGNIISIKGGINHTLALTKDGKVYAWGLNSSGQLGDDTTTNRTVPVLSKDSTGTEDNSNIYSIGSGSMASHSLAITKDGFVQNWGSNSGMQLGDSIVTRTLLPIYIMSKLKLSERQINLNVDETRTVTAEIESFNLFRLSIDESEEVVFTSMNPNIASVDSNGKITGHSIGITKIIASNPKYNKVAVLDVSVLSTGSIVTPKVSNGANHTVALKADGTVWTWGSNTYGQLGNGSNVTSMIPVKINITDVVDVVAGENFTMFLKSDGTVWASGQNNYGQCR